MAQRRQRFIAAIALSFISILFYSYNFLILQKQDGDVYAMKSSNGFTTENGIIIPEWNPTFIWERHMMSRSNTSDVPFHHFFVHVPKAGGTYFLHQINDIWFTSRVYRDIKMSVHSLEVNQKYYNYTLPPFDKSLFRACAVISNNIKEFHNKSFQENKGPNIEKGDRCTQYCYSLKGVRCDMWISESVYDQAALTVWPHQNSEQSSKLQSSSKSRPSRSFLKNEDTEERTKVYTIIREPTSHLLSQYFHCKESSDHAYARAEMASNIDEWLEYWSTQYQKFISNNDDRSDFKDGNITNLFQNTQQPNNIDIQWRKLMWKDTKYKCFVPVNFQSYALQFYPTSQVLLEHHATSNSRSNSNNSDATENISTPDVDLDDPIHINEINNLIQKFDVIGIQSQMEMSLCLIAVKYIGKLPERCDCTSSSIREKNQQQHINRNLRLNDHGVKHHGDSYKITTEQKKLMSIIQQKDMLLYEYAKIIFELQILQVEKELNVKMCTKLLPQYTWR